MPTVELKAQACDFEQRCLASVGRAGGPDYVELDGSVSNYSKGLDEVFRWRLGWWHRNNFTRLMKPGGRDNLSCSALLAVVRDSMYADVKAGLTSRSSPMLLYR